MLIDSHAHLDDTRFASDLDEVIERAKQAGVQRIIAVGAGLEESRTALKIAGQYPDYIHPVVGIHPHDADSSDGSVRGALAELAQDSRVIGIGETGLDYHYNHSSRGGQQNAFRWQIELSLDRGLPLVVHCRDAYDDCIRILSEYKGRLRGVAHCFSGDQRAADAFLDLGLYLSFSGTLAFPKAESLRAVAQKIPPNRILIETDCPYLAPPPHRGKRNEPAYVTIVAEMFETLRGSETVEAITHNTMTLFGLH